MATIHWFHPWVVLPVGWEDQSDRTGHHQMEHLSNPTKAKVHSQLDVRDSSVESLKQHANHSGLKPSYHENFMFSYNIHIQLIEHWVPPRMPPRFSFNTDLTSSVNAQ
jgi:hypothetical protein